jgi:MFS family permease
MGASSTSPRLKDCSFGDLSRTQSIFALMSVVLTLLTATMNQAIGIAAMPRAIAALNGFARYSWPTTSFLLTSTIAMPVFAKLSDLYGRKWFYLWSTVALVVSLLLATVAIRFLLAFCPLVSRALGCAPPGLTMGIPLPSTAAARIEPAAVATERCW